MAEANLTPPPSLVTLSTDLLLSVLHFLNAPDTARSCKISHAFQRLVQEHDEILFRSHVLRQRLVSLPTAFTPEENLAAARTLQNALTPPGGWKGLYHVTKLLGVPCLGYFRRVPRDLYGDYRGQLMRLRPAFDGECDFGVEDSNLCPTAGPGLCLEILPPKGKGASAIFVRLCETRKTKGGLVLEGHCKGTLEQQLEVEWQASTAVSDLDDENEGEGRANQATGENGRRPCFELNFQAVGMVDGESFFYERSFHALLSDPPSLRIPEKDRDVLDSLRGFWVGTYGSHGPEIIQVRFTTTITTTTTTTTGGSGATAATGAAAPVTMLEGLKIVGDANVPGNEWSFRVDVSRGPMDKAQALRADTRPVYTLGAHMEPMPRVLSQEAGRIHSIYRGKGQINMVSGTWAPQEVGVDLVVLRSEEKEGMGGLWVVWHDVEYASRHCIDLTRFVEVGGIEEEREEEDGEVGGMEDLVEEDMDEEED